MKPEKISSVNRAGRRRKPYAAMAMALLWFIGNDAARADAAPASDYYPPQPKPAAALEALKALQGSWSCRGVLAAGAIVPGTPEAKYRSNIRIDALYDGFAYSVAYKQTFEDKQAKTFAGTWYVSWDALQNKLVYFWVDMMGTVGQGGSPGWNNNILVLTGEGSVVEPGKDGQGQSRHTLLRDTFTRESADKLHWKGELKIDGAPDWIVIGDDRCERTQNQR